MTALQQALDEALVDVTFAKLLPAIALDEQSVRSKDVEGRLRIAKARLTKEDVNPYYGREIPHSEEMGLEPEKVYWLLRPGSEIEKAAATSNGIQLLKKHDPVSADDHKGYAIVGTIGTNAQWEPPFLVNSLVVWAQDAIEGIEDDSQRELSCGYHYRPVMTPGVFNGKHYDGVMTDLVFNHVALVKDGRAGPDVMVGDSKENFLMAKSTRLGALALNLTAGFVSPLLAMDSKVALPKDLFAPITTKSLKGDIPKITAALRKALDGKLRKGIALDATAEGLKNLLCALEETTEGADESASQEQHNAMEAAAHGESNLGIPKAVGAEFEHADKGKGFDEGPMRDFLKGKGVSDEDIEAAMDMIPKMGGAVGDESETPEEKEARMKKEKEAEDAKKARDAELTERPTKAAMDAAIMSATAGAIASERKRQEGIRDALAKVRPLVGDLHMAFDSGADVFRHVLNAKGYTKTSEIKDAAALEAMVDMIPKASERVGSEQRLAQDAAQSKDFSTRFPSTDRIGIGS